MLPVLLHCSSHDDNGKGVRHGNAAGRFLLTIFGQLCKNRLRN